MGSEETIDLKSLVERVKKLLRMAAEGSGATEAEAAAAMAEVDMAVTGRPFPSIGLGPERLIREAHPRIW